MSVLNTLNSYGSGFQVKVISSLLKHKEFLQNIIDVLDAEEFDNPSHKWVIKEIIKYYQKYHTTATPEFLSIEVRKMDNDVLKVSVAEQLKEALKSSNDDRQYVEEEFSNFCKNQQLKKALLTSVDLLGKNQYDDIRNIIDKALKAGQDKLIGLEYEKDIESRYRQDDRKPVVTPWPHINDLLMGGLGIGDFGIVFGSPGAGKSWILINLGAEAVKAGFNVNHYTLELSQEYVGKRYDAIFTGIDFQQIHLHRKEIESAIEKLPGKLTVKEYPMGKTTISTIESHIQKCQALGKTPDLVIIDYVDLLKSKSRSAERRDEIDDVYTATKGMARQFKIPVWTVSQVNRAGANDNVIEGDKAAGSYGKIMIADFIMSLSRKRQDKANGTGRMHIMKNRFGSDGMTYAAKINTSNGFIQIDSGELDDDQMEKDSPQNKQINKSNFSSDEKQYLKSKFFELGL
jgi:replicative DNA helicase